MRLAISEGPRRCCSMLAALGLCAMAVPWTLPLLPLPGAILFDAGSVAALVGLLFLLSDFGGAT